MLFATLLAALALAQPSSNSPLAPEPNGMHRADPTFVALANCTAHPEPGQTISHATIVFRDGRIVEILPGSPGPDGQANTADDMAAPAPAGARVVDCTGLHAYAAFIEPYLEIDAPKPAADAPGKHWNESVVPQRSALDGAANLRKADASLRKLGFGAAAISPKGGIFRGSSALVSLATPIDEPSSARPPVYRDNVYQSLGLSTAGDDSAGSYPSSLMGAIALIRQTLSDADWQAAGRANGTFTESTNCLDVLSSLSPSAGRGAAPRGGEGLPTSTSTTSSSRGTDVPSVSPPSTSSFLLFDSSDELDALRSLKLAAEFHRPAVILGSGNEYKRLAALHKASSEWISDLQQIPVQHATGDIALNFAQTPPHLVLPLSFPKEPDVSSISKAESIDLESLMSWEQAPTNPRRLAAAGIDFALTTHRLKNRDEFLANLRTAIKHGLTEDQALAALTTHPATLLGVSDSLGTLAPRKRANIVLCDSPLFAARNPETKKTPQIRDVYIDGLKHEINAPPAPKLEGEWKLELLGGTAPGGPALRAGSSPRPPSAPAEGAAESSRPGEASVPDAGFPAADRSLIFDKDNALTIKRNAKSTKADKVQITHTTISFVFDHEPLNENAEGPKGVVTHSGAIERDGAGTITRLSGAGTRPDGRPFSWSATKLPPHPFIGSWRVSEADGALKDLDAKDGLTIDITATAVTLTFAKESGDPTIIKADDVKVTRDGVTFTHPLEKLGGTGKSADTLRIEGGTLVGESTLPDDSKHAYKAKRREKPAKDDEDDDKAERERIAAIPDKLPTPFGPYGFIERPAQSSVILHNATLWTNTARGVIKNGWLHIENGKIAAIGEGDPRIAGDAIDCKGAHITPGIIDAHSHTGISRGVNEFGRSISAEARIQDVTDPDAISWYRQLAGGVTTVLSLHGSANAIGGQSQTNKNRWGCDHPDDMHFEGAIPGIKFALGENPRQANGDRGERTRYPQTRMGVETIIRDRFTQAAEYAARGGLRSPSAPAEGAAEPQGARPGEAPRRDLQLEALAEILAGKRLVHCHSYRQDEIVMLTQVARDFGFKIGTFQHILEGYKVADFLRDYSGGASGFTDWWAYKIEVQDAIPYAFPIMHEVGVTTSFNSDSDELARRLNAECGKAVKYGGGRISPEEAMKFVTLNPAKQLHINNRVGTLEAGKDADIAVWSGPPYSSLVRCTATYVDGRRLFSLEDDAKHRETITKERQRIIQKILSKPHKKGDKDKKGDADKKDDADKPASDEGPRRRRRPPSEAEERLEHQRERMLELMMSGKDPESARCGECGCEE